MTDALEKPAPMTITKDDVIEFIKNHPEDAEIFEALIPEKKRGKRGQPADFQAYMIERLKSDKQNVIESTREIVENSRANMNNQQRIHAAVLRLLEATTFEDFIHSITMDLASILDVDIAVLSLRPMAKTSHTSKPTAFASSPKGQPTAGCMKKTYYFKITLADPKPSMAAAQHSCNHKSYFALISQWIPRPLFWLSVAATRICSAKARPPTKSFSSPASSNAHSEAGLNYRFKKRRRHFQPQRTQTNTTISCKHLIFCYNRGVRRDRCGNFLILKS